MKHAFYALIIIQALYELVKCQVWDDEECDDYECDKEAVEELAYLDDIIGNMED